MDPQPPQPAWRPPTRVTPAQRLSAAMRLLTLAPGDKREAARRFLLAAPSLGIDPSLMWVTTSPEGVMRELCLGAKGSGRTVTMVLAPEPLGAGGSALEAAARIEECAALIEEAVAGIGAELGAQVGLFQVLLGPGEVEAYEAFARAGFWLIGDLAYLRLMVPTRPVLERSLGDLLVRPLSDLGPPASWRAMMVDLLDATYVETLDCPGLCGLRKTADILDSHLAAGRWDPRWWWIAFAGDRPVGCALVNLSTEGSGAELVYLGLAPEARGRGAGGALLEHALARLPARSVREVTCAVDRANGPALRTYARAGFEEFGARRALVRGAEGTGAT